MDYFYYRQQQAYCEERRLVDIAQQFGTPLYVYSKQTILRHLKRLQDAFSDYPTLICYAMKANSNHHLVKILAQEGFGADLVSLGELKRAQLAGMPAERLVFSGVGKTKDEINDAVSVGILSFNAESAFELEMIETIAQQQGKKVAVSIRVNPNIDAETNPKISTGLFTSKFGSSEDDAFELIKSYSERAHISVVGVSCHIGSQITELRPLKAAADRMVRFVKRLQQEKIELQYLNMGGGLGIRYKNELLPEVESYAEVLMSAARELGLKLIIEPGRLIMGNAGILLTQVIGVKITPKKRFVVVDGAMNDLMRPSLYDSYHEILPVHEAIGQPTVCCDIVGPICETGDFFGKERFLPHLMSDDLLWIRGCGAYAASMASNYNSRPRAAEVLVDGSEMTLIRKRERIEAVWRDELI